MMALEESAVGNTTVKSPAVDVLSPPKSNTATALSLCVSLYINAPRAVIVAVENVKSLKSKNAVVPEDVGATAVSAAPAAVYPVPETSLEVVYAVVLASKEADEVYNANLKLSADVSPRATVVLNA